MNTLIQNLNYATNEFKSTENGAIARTSAGSALYDLFALGASYRSRSDEDCIFLFKKAYKENPVYALKCLFYIRNVRGGQGERRFFRVVMRWFADHDTEAAERNLKYIAEFGRWDDLYLFVGTKLEKAAFEFMYHQLALDVQCETPSLLAKWLKSENTSSAESCALGTKTRKAFNMTPKQYRKTLSILRKRINVLERLMSENRWDEIQFDKIPSKAGLIYKNAFAKHDIERAKAGVQTYEQFAKSEDTKVNAGALYPYEIVGQAILHHYESIGSTNRLMDEKYWDNQIDYLEGKPCKMMCVVDTSGSMTWGEGSIKPIDIAISLGMYCAERVGGDFKDHFITFSRNPQLVKVDGVDFVDKVYRIYKRNQCENTDLIKTFELLRKMSLKARPEDRLDTVVIISDMEIDLCTAGYYWNRATTYLTDMEEERLRWEECGLVMPRLVYWNVNARNDTILDKGPNVSLVSGASASLFKQILTGKTGYDLMMEVLDSEVYSCIS